MKKIGFKVVFIIVMSTILLVLYGFFQKEKLNLKYEIPEYKKITDIELGKAIYSNYKKMNYKTSMNIIIPFSIALKMKFISLEDIISNMELIDISNDGGSELYKLKQEHDEFSNVDFVLVKCNNIISKNQNIYISSTLNLSNLPCEN